MRAELTKYGDPILESVAEPFSDFDSAAELAQKLQSFLTDKRVKWISAKHLGINSRFIVVEKSLDDRSEFITMINPEVINFHGPILSRVESDFSLPGLNVSVERRADATICFQDENGHQHERRFAGPTCRVILQAIDQLDGKLMIINLNKYRRQSIKGYLRHLSKNLEQQAEKAPQTT